MRDRRLLSARGHPDRLKGGGREKRGRAERAKDRQKKKKRAQEEGRRTSVKGNQDCEAYQGHLGKQDRRQEVNY